MCNNKVYLDGLRANAMKSPINRRCAAMIVHKGKVMAVGYNYCKRGTIRNSKYCFLCA